MYDVLYLDRGNRQNLVATGLGRDAACDLAMRVSRERKVGRMFLAGSEEPPRGEMILIVASQQRAA